VGPTAQTDKLVARVFTGPSSNPLLSGLNYSNVCP